MNYISTGLVIIGSLVLGVWFGMTTATLDGPGATPVICEGGTACTVTLKQTRPRAAWDVPAVIVKNSVGKTTPIVWKIDSAYADFNPAGGIDFAKGGTPNPAFTCQPDGSDKQKFNCSSAPSAPGSSPYSVRSKGLLSPDDIDPWVVNL